MKNTKTISIYTLIKETKKEQEALENFDYLKEHNPYNKITIAGLIKQEGIEQ